MILVTGGTGLVGSHIVRDLLSKGYSVKVLKRKNSKVNLIADLANQVTFAEGDLLDISSLEDALAGVNTVIHSGGYISFDKSHADLLYKINVEGTANLVNVSLMAGIEKFIHISSVAAIGKKKGMDLVEEAAKWEEETVSDYAKSKFLSEVEVWRAGAEGLPIVILNPSVVLGPGDWNSGSTFLFRYVWKKPPFYTGGNLNYIDVRDVSRVVSLLLETKISNERFILNAGTMPYKLFFEKVAQQLKVSPPALRIPEFLLRTLIPFEKIRALISGRSPLITKETVAGAVNKTSYDNSKAKNFFNLAFKDINETIAWTSEELIKRYNIQINNF